MKCSFEETLPTCRPIHRCWREIEADTRTYDSITGNKKENKSLSPDHDPLYGPIRSTTPGEMEFSEIDFYGGLPIVCGTGWIKRDLGCFNAFLGW